MKEKECVITGIKYDKKKRALIASLFIETPRELINDVPHKDIMHRIRNTSLILVDEGIVRQSLYDIIEAELL